MTKQYIIQQKIDEFYLKKCLENQEYRNMKKEDFLKKFNLYNVCYQFKKSFPKISEIVRICHDLNLTLKDLKKDCEKFSSSKNENMES